MGEGGLGPAVAIAQRVIAVCCAVTTQIQAIDLKGLQGAQGRGGYHGIDAGFCGPSRPDFGLSWGFGVCLMRRRAVGGLAMPIFTV